MSKTLKLWCLPPLFAVGVCHTTDNARVMGREVSCEIALKKGAKREGNGRDQQQRGGAERSTDPKEAAASSYGGGTAARVKRPAATPPTPAPAAVTPDKEAEPAEGVVAEKAAEGGDGSSKVSKREGSLKVSKREDQLKEAIAAAEATGLGKKEARKFARKAMKKELKRKAKERAKEKKEAQASLDAAAAAAAESTPPVEDGEAEATEGGEGEPVDPKAAKLVADAKTLLVFGVADDLTAKQLQKRVKKVRTSTWVLGGCGPAGIQAG